MYWQEEALKALEEGRTVQVRPRGHSMTGRIGDGDLVILKPCATEELIVGAIVLVRIQGKRFSHIVLHSILSVEGNRYHIGIISAAIRAVSTVGLTETTSTAS
jgi:hypothetical protein